MTIATVRRLAADIMNVGQNKVRIRPDDLKEAEGALTRADVKSLIEKGIVSKAKKPGRDSTGRTGRRGHGRRRGTPVDSKDVWMDKVRSQRKMLRMLISSGAVKKEAKRALYYKVKSGIFRNKRAMLLYLKDNKLVAPDYEMPKTAYQKPAHKGRHAAKPGMKKEAGKPEAKGEKRAPEAKAQPVAPRHEGRPSAHEQSPKHEKKGEGK